MDDWEAISTKPPPHSGPEFEEMMRDVDRVLVAAGHPIANRPLLAAREISMSRQVPIPMGANPSLLPPELRPFAPLGQAISQWYEHTYGDRLKVDMTPGRVVAELDGDLYVLKVPRIFGQVQLVISRTFLSTRGIGRGPATCNILQLIEGLTPAKAALLSDASLQHLNDVFGRALPALYTVENTRHDLMASARGDLSSAVNGLMDRDQRFGASRWASLQAAEKVLKAAIALHGGMFKKTHILAELCVEIRELGVAFDEPELVSAIQCSPAIRYGQETCSQAAALAAHHASLDLVTRLREGGARFELGLN